ncbi:phosphotransferase [Microbacterium sp. SLBN-111]|uniref:phosphotransferase n=2 Tax=Bacteria TaxID=2 RepID=UPI003C78EF25
MARSPFTLAASATAALPGIGVTGTAPLTENAAGRFDSALLALEDGRTVVVRMPADEDAAADLAAESRALHALTSGVRALLPFRAPEVVGESGSGVNRVLVVDVIDGYRIDPTELPKGPGYAPAIGAALAAVHALPVSIVRTDGLPVRAPEQVRDDVARLLDRADATGRVPDGLMMRWRRALRESDLWRFESAVILGGATSASILLVDDADGIPHVSGILDWSGLSVGDPAVDLRWLASAPTATDDVYDGYAASGVRSPDPLLRERARLYAELEFAKWLVHGHDAGEADVVADAVALLEALADGVRGDHIVASTRSDIDDALALVERVPPAAASAVDTSMQTDTYDPEALALYLEAERERDAAAPAGAATGTEFGVGDAEDDEPGPTAPIDLEGWTPAPVGVSAETDGATSRDDVEGDADTPAGPQPTGEVIDAAQLHEAIDDEEDAARASRAALRRWGVARDDA